MVFFFITFLLDMFYELPVEGGELVKEFILLYFEGGRVTMNERKKFAILSATRGEPDATE
jgi:hypothetical protein